MRFCEFTTKPQTVQQSRINALKQQKERVSTQLKNEREKQQRQKASQAIQKNSSLLSKLNNN